MTQTLFILFRVLLLPLSLLASRQCSDTTRGKCDLAFVGATDPSQIIMGVGEVDVPFNGGSWQY